VVKKEDEEKDAEKKKVIGEIQVDLDKIKESGEKKGHKAILEFVYKEYAPKNPAYKLKESIKNDGELKKAFKVALTHYHPDKNLAKEHGYAWYFIAETIAKELGRVYEMLKATEDSTTNFFT
jgi:hypothetical protein